MNIDEISAQVVGEQLEIETPFGRRPLVYADYTASGRAWGPIEDFIRERVLPFYANTHSESSLTGRQSMGLREEAREIIRSAVNAGDEHAVIFCGTGATAAVNKLVDILNLRLPADLDARHRLREKIPTVDRPVVFIGPYEHHSNELPWRESIADVEVIGLTAEGLLDLSALETALERYQHRRHLYGSFSAASNVTGLKTDTQAVGELMHRYGGSVFWDCAAAAPYVATDVSDKDAVFISPHKFLGGPGTPGLLIVRRSLLRNSVPAQPGGGTVAFVTPDYHRYLEDPEKREEGGTPGVVESIRAGLVFKLQQEVGTQEIELREERLVKQVLSRWSQHPSLRILGNTSLPRLSIVSFQVMRGKRPLHYAYVVALLNDLFGIQARGGCSCAGPYGHSLLNIDADTSRDIDAESGRGNLALRPGWVRVNFNYFIDSETLEYILAAVEMIADRGWALQGQYSFDPESGSWLHAGKRSALPVSLADFRCGEQAPQSLPRSASSYSSHLREAQALLRSSPTDCGLPQFALSAAAERLRWYYLPEDDKEASSDKRVPGSSLTGGIGKELLTC